MKIDKAIKILSRFGRYGDDVKFRDIKEAVKLGKEALKSIQSSRRLGFGGIIVNLPGETRE